MKYTIQPVTPADAPFMATIVDEAFQNDGIVGLISPNVPKDIYHAYNTKRLTQDIAQRHLEGAHFYKAVEEETGFVIFTSFTSKSCPGKKNLPCCIPQSAIQKERLQSWYLNYKTPRD